MWTKIYSHHNANQLIWIHFLSRCTQKDRMYTFVSRFTPPPSPHPHPPTTTPNQPHPTNPYSNWVLSKTCRGLWFWSFPDEWCRIWFSIAGTPTKTKSIFVSYLHRPPRFAAWLPAVTRPPSSPYITSLHYFNMGVTPRNAPAQPSINVQAWLWFAHLNCCTVLMVRVIIWIHFQGNVNILEIVHSMHIYLVF